MPGLRAMPAVTDHHIAVGRRLVGSRAGDSRVESFDRRRLIEIERLALGHALDLWNIDQDNIAKFLAGCPMGGGGSNISGTNDADFRATHETLPFLLQVTTN